METVIEMLSRLIDPSKAVMICGDMNICFSSSPDNSVVKSLIQNCFDQIVKEATHINGGLIDHVYFRSSGHQLNAEVSMYSPYYTAHDHDALLVEVSGDKSVI